jgi:hypothetical protein
MMEIGRRPAVKSMPGMGVEQYRRGPSPPQLLSIHGTVAQFRDRIVRNFTVQRDGGERCLGADNRHGYDALRGSGASGVGFVKPGRRRTHDAWPGRVDDGVGSASARLP